MAGKCGGWQKDVKRVSFLHSYLSPLLRARQCASPNPIAIESPPGI
jgi:hypothetical protein